MDVTDVRGPLVIEQRYRANKAARRTVNEYSQVSKIRITIAEFSKQTHSGTKTYRITYEITILSSDTGQW